MLLRNDQKAQQFNIVQSEYEGYKRWGFAAGYTIPNRNRVNATSKSDETLQGVRKDQGIKGNKNQTISQIQNIGDEGIKKQSDTL